MKIPFSPPRIDDAVIAEVVDSLKSGWITTGPKTKALEKEVCALAQCEAALCVSSATSGMEHVLRWFGVGSGDEVIIPAYTYCATANIVVHCGAKPILVDMVREDFTMDIGAIGQHINSKTKAIIPVDIGGLPVDYEALNKLMDANQVEFQPSNEIQKKLGRILIMTDAAHSIGSIYKGKPAALQVDAAVFSFHAVKNVTTAEGGAICFNMPEPFDNKQLYKDFNRLSLHGQDKDALAKFGANKWEYDVPSPGFKFNMPDVLAAIGLVEIRRYQNEHLPRRKAIFEQYKAHLSKFSWAELPIFEDESRCTSYHLFLLRIKGISLEKRAEIIDKLANDEISVNVHYKPIPMLSYYANNGYSIDDFPNSKDAWQRVITLPVYYNLNEDQIDHLLNHLTDAVETVLG